MDCGEVHGFQMQVVGRFVKSTGHCEVCLLALYLCGRTSCDWDGPACRSESGP